MEIALIGDPPVSECLPEIRAVEVLPFEHEGKTMIQLRDPFGYATAPLVLSPLAFLIASGLDGTRDCAGVREALLPHTGGEAIPDAQILEVAAFLDEQGYLLTPRFDTLRQRVNDSYRSAPARPAALAGHVYAADPAALRLEMEAYLATGTVAHDAAVAELTRCLIVPHIDYARGAPAYAHGFRRLAQGPKPRVAIVFGVAHAGPESPFVLTRHAFETPLGTVPAATDIIDRLAAACTWDPFQDEIVHRDEHSVELQAVMLAHLYGSDVSMVPILCGGFDAANPDPGVEQFLAACKREAGEEGVMVIAGADLAHVGRAFGDDFDIDDGVVSRMRERDEADLAHALAGDGPAWYDAVMRDGNARRVCGLQCIYSALRATEGLAAKAELLDYGYAHDDAGGIVTFSAIAAA